MSKSWRDKPRMEREIAIRKALRGNHKHMEPYKRTKQHGYDEEESLV